MLKTITANLERHNSQPENVFISTVPLFLLEITVYLCKVDFFLEILPKIFIRNPEEVRVVPNYRRLKAAYNDISLSLFSNGGVLEFSEIYLNHFNDNNYLGSMTSFASEIHLQTLE